MLEKRVIDIDIWGVFIGKVYSEFFYLIRFKYIRGVFN